MKFFKRQKSIFFSTESPFPEKKELQPGFDPALLQGDSDEQQFEEARMAFLSKKTRSVLPVAQDFRVLVDKLAFSAADWPIHAVYSEKTAISALSALDSPAPEACAVPIAWLERIQDGPPVPISLGELGLSVDENSVIWADPAVYAQLCTVYGVFGLEQRRHEPPIAVRFEFGRRAVVLLAPFRAPLKVLFVRACAAMALSPQGRALERVGDPSFGQTESLLGPAVVAAGLDVHALGDVKAAKLTFALVDRPGETSSVHAEQGKRQLEEGIRAVEEAKKASALAFSAILEWKRSIEVAKMGLVVGKAAIPPALSDVEAT